MVRYVNTNIAKNSKKIRGILKCLFFLRTTQLLSVSLIAKNIKFLKITFLALCYSVSQSATESNHPFPSSKVSSKNFRLIAVYPEQHFLSTTFFDRHFVTITVIVTVTITKEKVRKERTKEKNTKRKYINIIYMC